ncbi:hypothetical protein BDW75DRAFT_237894, partial [Aspergillus navahoensis]
MQLIRVLPAPLFAALAVSAPLAAPQISVNYEQLRQLSQEVQQFAHSTTGQFSSISTEFESVYGSLTGSTQESLARLLSSLSESVGRIQQVSSTISTALDDSTSSYEGAESSAAIFTRRSATSAEADNRNWDRIRARDDTVPQSMAEVGTDSMAEKEHSIAAVSPEGPENAKDAVVGSGDVGGDEIMGPIPTASPGSTESVAPVGVGSVGDGSVAPSQTGIDQSLSPVGNAVDQSVSPEGTGVDQSLSPEGNTVDQSISPEGNTVDQSISPEGNAVDESLSPEGT